MSDFLKQCGGYTPIPDVLVREYGVAIAQTWGIIWRYCQGEKGLCDASNETIAGRVGVSRRAVCDYIKQLTTDGFVEDLDPGKRNCPHRLKIGIGEDKILGMQILHTSDVKQQEEMQQDGMQDLPTLNGDGMQELHTGMQNLHSRYAGIAHPGMQNLHKKTESKIESKTESKRELQKPKKPKSEPPPVIPAFKIFVDVTKCYSITTYWRNKMAEEVGNEPDKLELWKNVLIGWAGMGWNIRNVKGQLECLGRGEIPGKEQRNGHNNYNRDRNGASPTPGQAEKLKQDQDAIRVALAKRAREREADFAGNAPVR